MVKSDLQTPLMERYCASLWFGFLYLWVGNNNIRSVILTKLMHVKCWAGQLELLPEVPYLLWPDPRQSSFPAHLKSHVKLLFLCQHELNSPAVMRKHNPNWSVNGSFFFSSVFWEIGWWCEGWIVLLAWGCVSALASLMSQKRSCLSFPSEEEKSICDQTNWLV